MSRQLIIVACSDPLLWYRGLVGKAVPLLRDIPREMCWLSKDPEGLTNIVKHCDAVPMPSGFKLLVSTDLLHHRDFVLHPGEPTYQWHVVTPEQIGTQVGARLSMRAIDQQEPL